MVTSETAPGLRVAGEIDVGLGPAPTVKPLTIVPRPPSGLMTTTSTGPTVAFVATLIVATILSSPVALLVTTTDKTVTPGPRSRVLPAAGDAGATKPGPVTVTVWLRAP